MKNIKKLVATLGFIGIIILTNTTAHAGIIMAGKSATPTDTKITKSIFDSFRNIIIGQITGVKIQETEGIMMADRTGIMLAD